MDVVDLCRWERKSIDSRFRGNDEKEALLQGVTSKEADIMQLSY
jgi:hypothetical protein